MHGVLDGAEIAVAALCDVHNCPTCDCPKSELDNTETLYATRSFCDLKRKVYAALGEFLNADEKSPGTSPDIYTGIYYGIYHMTYINVGIYHGTYHIVYIMVYSIPNDIYHGI